MINNKSNELTQYVPKCEWQNDTRQQYIYKKLQDRLNWIESIFEEIVNNAYIKDANEVGIARFEQEFGIVPTSDMTLEDRKSKLLSILRGQGGVTNIAKLKTIASSFECGDIDVITDYKNYKYTVKFTSVKGVPTRLDDVKDSINAVNPAHLLTNYEFNYMRWGELYGNPDNTTPYKWGELKMFTWGDVLNGNIYHNTNYYTKSNLITNDNSNIVTNDGFGIKLVEIDEDIVRLTDENENLLMDENYNSLIFEE